LRTPCRWHLINIFNQTGQNKIQISELSSAIDTESVRVSGLGSEARLFDVVCKVEEKHGADLSHDSSSEVIRLLNVKKQSLMSQKRVLDHESELLVSYAKTLSGEHVNPTAMGEFLKGFVTKGTENLEAVSKIEEKIVEVKRLIEKETAKSDMKKGQCNGQVIIVVVAAQESTIDLKLTYSELLCSNYMDNHLYLHLTSRQRGRLATDIRTTCHYG